MHSFWFENHIEIMKRLCIIAVIFLVCISRLSAQDCYVILQEKEYKVYSAYAWQTPTKEYDLPFPCESIKFDAKREKRATGSLKLDQNVDESWENIFNENTGEAHNNEWFGGWVDYKSYGPLALDRHATKIKFYQKGADLAQYFKNVRVTMATYVDPPSVSALTFHEQFLGAEDETQTLTIDWCNVEPLQVSIVGEDASLFSYVIENNASACNYGKATIRVSYLYANPGKHSTKLIVTNSTTGYRQEITLSGITNRHIFSFDVQDGDWEESSNWTYNGSTTHGLLPTPSDTVIISQTCKLSSHQSVDCIEMCAGGKLVIGPQGGLSVSHRALDGLNASNLTICNNAEGAGFIKFSPSVTELPTATILYTPQSTADEGVGEFATYQYMGAPGKNVSFSMNPTQGAIYLWDEPTDWQTTPATFTMTPFAGYALTQFGHPVYALQAQLVNTPQQIHLTYTEGGMFRGENLFANSYMAPIDVRTFSEGDISGNADKTLYVYNTGSYAEWKEHHTVSDAASPGAFLAIPMLSAAYLPASETTIAPMQGVMMVAHEGGATLWLHYERHVWHSMDDVNYPMRAPRMQPSEHLSYPIQRRIRLSARAEHSGAKRLYILEDSTFTADYDNGYDAPQYYETDNLLRIYTNESFGQMEVSATNKVDSMFIGFHAGEDTHYTLTFSDIIGDSLFLQDRENEDSVICIVEGGQYGFEAKPFSTNDFRFRILRYHNNRHVDDEIPTYVATPVAQPRVWCDGQRIFVSDAAEHMPVVLYSIRGDAVSTTHIHYSATISMESLERGIYVLRLGDCAYKVVRR